MAGRDIFPNMAGERDGGRFRTGTNRKVDLALQLEVDNVGKKSIADIIVAKELSRAEPLTTPERTIRKLAPEFIPQNTPGKRKSQPIFHDGSQSPRSQSPLHPTLPKYNPLDKEKTFTAKLIREDSKSNKLPFSKENTVTVDDMKKQRVTSLGVLPPQHGKPFPELNVLMEGVAAKNHDDPILGPVQRANTAPKVETEILVQEPTFMTAGTSRGSDPKPAILGTIGTLQSVMLTERPAPAAKPMSRLRVPRTKSAKSVHSDSSSFKSIDIHLPSESGENANLEQQAPKPDGHRSQASSAVTMKSVKDLLEEAKKIASPEGSQKCAPAKRIDRREDTKKQDPSLPQKGPGKLASKGSTVDRRRTAKAKTADEQEETKERSVDEIIKSLKEQANSGMVSEADRKIQEIMNKVITRSKAVLGDLAPGDPEDTEQSTQDHEAELFPQIFGDTNHLEQDLHLESCAVSSNTDRPHSGDEGITEAEDNSKEDNSDENLMEQEPQIVVTEPLDEDDYNKEGEDLLQQPSGHTAAIDEALERLSEIHGSVTPPDVDKGEVKADGTPDLSQAWEDLMAPAEVAVEDILSVKAKPSQLHHKSPSDDAKPIEAKTPGPMSLLGSWTPVKSDTGDSSEKRSGKRESQRGPVKSIHHFCTVREDIQLPDHQRGVWRRYHVPSKYDYLYKEHKIPEGSESAVVHNTSPQTPSTEACDITSTQRPHSGAKTALDQHQSVMAQKILEEAAKITEEGGLDKWQERAQQVFDQAELTVDGKKLELKSDESFLYWTPAPPKWDVAPQNVKDALFPSYHGAELGLDVGGFSKAGDDNEEEDEEDEDGEEEDPAVREARERILSRQHGSARDLTNLDKTKIQKAQEETPEHMRLIKGSIRLPEETFSVALGDKDSVEYAAKRAQIEEVFSKVFANLLTDYYRGIQDISFSGGSLVVHYSVSVPEQAPPELSENLEDSLVLAIKRGMFGDFMVDSDAISVEDDLTSKADLLMREMSHQTALISRMSPLKMSGRREQSDVTGTMTQRKVDSVTRQEHDQRRNSAPDLVDIEEDDTLLIYQDFASAMEELKRQKEQLKDTKASKKRVQGTETQSLLETPDLTENASNFVRQNDTFQEIDSPRTTIKIEDDSRSKFSVALSKQRESKKTPAEEALEAGRSYVLLPSKSKKKKVPTATLR